MLADEAESPAKLILSCSTGIIGEYICIGFSNGSINYTRQRLLLDYTRPNEFQADIYLAFEKALSFQEFPSMTAS